MDMEGRHVKEKLRILAKKNVALLRRKKTGVIKSGGTKRENPPLRHSPERSDAAMTEDRSVTGRIKPA
jgi:hypothetical protein